MVSLGLAAGCVKPPDGPFVGVIDGLRFALPILRFRTGAQAQIDGSFIVWHGIARRYFIEAPLDR